MIQMIRVVIKLFGLVLLVGATSAQGGEANWQPLFDGQSLNDWRQLGGAALYRAENGEIVGVAVANSPNSFLVTNKTFDDFILEYDVFVDSSLNSGVQIRSGVSKKGTVYGYQVELDPSESAFSGGIYDESRRGWLYPLSRNSNAQKALRNGQWNHFRVEAVGNTIRTWVNGVPAANLVDDMTSGGFVGLQVHSVKDVALAGKAVRWKNIRILTDNLKAHRRPVDPEVDEVSYLKNRLTEYEKRQGWRLLWDGRSSKGWRGAKLDHFPKSGWRIKNGVLTILRTDGAESTGPGDIVTEANYSNFELELEFNITQGANSGIKYFVDPHLNKQQGSAIGCEFQVLDDINHPDAKKGVNGNRTVGSLYDLITAENLSVRGRSKQFKGIGQWNKARIVSSDGKVEHWLNNEKVVEYDRNSQMFRALVAYSKYGKWPGFGQWPEGRILLQDHGDTVHYRSIKIREL